MTPALTGTATVWVVGFRKESLADARLALISLRRRLGTNLKCFRIRLIAFRFPLPALRRAQKGGQAPDVVLLTPAFATWSRLPAAGPVGPRAIRSRTWPWGLPCLSTAWRRRCGTDNVRMKHLLQLFQQLALRHNPAIIVYTDSEDIGDATVSTASSWQLDELRCIARAGGLQRWSCFQCLLGASDRPRPTAFLTNCHLTSPFVIGPTRWPNYIYQGGKARYQGPLKLPCGCGQWHHSVANVKGIRNKAPSRKLLTPAAWDMLLASALTSARSLQICGAELLREGAMKVDPSNHITINGEETTDVDSVDAIDAMEAHPRQGQERQQPSKGGGACVQAPPPSPPL